MSKHTENLSNQMDRIRSEIIYFGQRSTELHDTVKTTSVVSPETMQEILIVQQLQYEKLAEAMIELMSGLMVEENRRTDNVMNRFFRK